jgi:hypothetical protein
MCQLKRFMLLFTSICSSQEVSQVSYQAALRGEEEGAIQNVSGGHSDDRLSFLKTLTTFSLLESRPGAKRELAGLSLNQEASQKELEGVQKMAQRRTLPGPKLKKAKNKCASIYNC